MSKERLTFAINNSTSKYEFAFSKSSRFKTPLPNTNAFGYELKGQFGHDTGSGAGRGFSTSESRFLK